MPKRTGKRARTTFRRAVVGITGRIPAPVGEPVMVATDASSAETSCALGWIATSGHYGLRAHPYPPYVSGPDRVTIAELRAVDYALQQIRGEFQGPVHLLIDSRAALRFITSWQGGGEEFPRGYSLSRARGKRPTLVRLQARMRRSPTTTVAHVRAHTGQGLNEAADSLSKLASRYLQGWHDQPEVARLAQQWAERTLDSHS